MKKRQIVFYYEGSVACVRHSNGKKSEEWHSKIDALKGVESLRNKNMISEEELDLFRKQILDAASLPWENPDPILRELVSRYVEPLIPKSVPGFICLQGVVGVVLLRTQLIFDLFSKQSAFDAITELLSSGKITDAQWNDLHAKIVRSPLPDFVDPKTKKPVNVPAM